MKKLYKIVNSNPKYATGSDETDWIVSAGEAVKQTSVHPRKNKTKIFRLNLFPKRIQVVGETKNLEQSKSSVTDNVDRIYLRGLVELEKLQSQIDALSPEAKKLVGRHYDSESMSCFLIQCGQFTRLQSLWKTCQEVARRKALPPDIVQFLRTLVTLVNSASEKEKLSVIEAEAGSPYDYTKQDRVGPNGSCILRQLLPGLGGAAGNITCKVLVELC